MRRERGPATTSSAAEPTEATNTAASSSFDLWAEEDACDGEAVESQLCCVLIVSEGRELAAVAKHEGKEFAGVPVARQVERGFRE